MMGPTRLLVATILATMVLASDAFASRYIRLPYMSGLVCEVPMHPDSRTSVLLPEGGATMSLGLAERFDKHVASDHSQIHLQPREQLPPTNLNIIGPSANVALDLAMVATEREAAKIVEFVWPEDWTPEMAIGLELCDETRTLLGEREDTGLAARVAVAKYVAYYASEDEGALVPLLDPRQQSTSPMRVRLSAPHRHMGALLIPFAIEHAGTAINPIELTGVRIFDRDGHEMASELLYIDSFDSGAKGDDDFPTVRARSTIPRGGTARGTVSLPYPAARSLEPMRIEFLAQGVAPAVAAVRKWYPAYEDPPPFYVRTVAVGVQAIGGAVELANEAGVRGWTSFYGVGARASYGALSWLSVEGGLDVLRSGDADLEGVASSFTGGRLRLATVLRTGKRIQPHVRVGVGVAAGSQSAGGGESNFALSGFGNLGLGVDAWLTEQLSLGLSASAGVGQWQWVDASLHLSYSWRP